MTVAISQVDLKQMNTEYICDQAVPYEANPPIISAAHAAATVTIPADPSRPNEITQVHCGYSGTPGAGATLTITDAGTTVWQVPIPAAGPYEFNFRPARSNLAPNSTLVVTLSDGGAGVTGYVAVNAKKRL